MSWTETSSFPAVFYTDFVGHPQGPGSVSHSQPKIVLHGAEELLWATKLIGVVDPHWRLKGATNADLTQNRRALGKIAIILED